MSSYIENSAKLLIEKFSVIIIPGVTDIFAAKSVIVHIDSVIEKYSDCISAIEKENLLKQRDYIKQNYPKP